MKFKVLQMAAVAALLCIGAMPAAAQLNAGVSSTAQIHAGNVARACVDDQWETPACLTAMSESNLVMLGNYAEALQKAAKTEEVEILKQECAASTAHREKEFPAYAMTSAFNTCAAIIEEIVKVTDVLPDQSQYQLLFGALLCLNKDTGCRNVQDGLRRYK